MTDAELAREQLDPELAQSILRKIAIDDWASSIIVQRYAHGQDVLIDSSWVSITVEEADYLDRLNSISSGVAAPSPDTADTPSHASR